MRTLTFQHIIGSGSMGTVYYAELRAPGGFRRPCAVKVIRVQGPDREHFVSRMRDEARLLGMLQDEQILGVTELVTVDGHDAVVMEYVEGVDLQRLLKAHRVPPRALAELGAEIAGTLQRAHRAVHPSTKQPLNVIHRDIKPANIMVTVRGGVRLLDFGVARAAFASRESHTQGLVLGTLNYFPPEILAGEEPTTAVDIYGLGVSLWECASGEEWGPPRVQQARFEKRVDQRIAELGPDYGPLAPVLRQVLQWDPLLRPEGGVVERSLLHAADSSAGLGLRTWARDVVPQLLAQREKERPKDELVGRTIEIRSFEGDISATPAPQRTASPSSDGPSPLDQAPRLDPKKVPDPSTTWNGEGASGEPVPVPAAKGAAGAAKGGGAKPAPPAAARSGNKTAKPDSKPPAKGKKKKKAAGPSPGVAVALGVLLGLIVLLLFVLLLAGVIGVAVFFAG
jgi:serine/threonine protein kinase